METPSSASSV